MAETKNPARDGIITLPPISFRYGAWPSLAYPISSALITVRFRCGLLEPYGPFGAQLPGPFGRAARHRTLTLLRLSVPRYATYSSRSSLLPTSICQYYSIFLLKRQSELGVMRWNRGLSAATRFGGLLLETNNNGTMDVFKCNGDDRDE